MEIDAHSWEEKTKPIKANHTPLAGNSKDGIRNPKQTGLAEGCVKKQSQFSGCRIDIKVLWERDYWGNLPFRGLKNKANQSQKKRVEYRIQKPGDRRTGFVAMSAVEKTKPKPAFGGKSEIGNSKS